MTDTVHPADPTFADSENRTSGHDFVPGGKPAVTSQDSRAASPTHVAAFNVVERIIAELTATDPDRLCMSFMQRDGTYGEISTKEFLSRLFDAIDFIKQEGIAPGDIVLIVPGHNVETVLLLAGLIHMGATPGILPYLTPTSSRQTVLEALEIATQTGARWLLTTTEIPDHAAEALNGQLKTVTARFDPSAAPRTAAERPEPARVGGCAYLQLTSGTTGLARAIEVTQDAVWNQTEALMQAANATVNDVVVGWLPLNHDMGLVSQVFYPLLHGVSSIMISPAHWLRSPVTLLEAINRYRGTITFMPNFAYLYTARRLSKDDVRNFDLSCLRLAVNGAETVRPDSIAAFNQLVAQAGLKRNVVAPAYGMGENVLAATLNIPGPDRRGGVPRTLWISAGEVARSLPVTLRDAADADAVSVVSCGGPVPGVEIRIVYEDGKPVPDGVCGEIVIDGTSLCPRYVGESGEPIRTPDGYRTGDIGFLDEGELFVCGRIKELVIVSGRNVNPTVASAIAEKCLGGAFKRGIAFSVYDDELGTEALILVCETTRPLKPEDKSEVQASIRQSVLDSLQVNVSDILIRPNNWLPRTTSGKVNATKTREKYLRHIESLARDAAKKAGGEPPGDQSVSGIITHLATKATRTETVDPEASLFDQGMDSLSATELLLGVENEFGVRVAEHFFDEPTVASLIENVEAVRAGRDNSFRGELVTQNRVGDVLPLPDRIPADGGRIEHMLRFGPKRFRSQISYPVGFKIQNTLANSSYVRKLFDHELGIVRHWHQLIDRESDLEGVLHTSMIANTWVDWRNRHLSKEPGFSRHTRFSGALQLVDRKEGAKGIVVLFPHVARLYWPIFHYLRSVAGREIGIIRQATNFDFDGTNDDVSDKQIRAAQVWVAADMLKSGGAVMVAGDGLRGSTSAQVPFLGQSVRFQTGPAELAIRTGADMVAVFPDIADDGTVDFEFVGPLYSDKQQAADRARDIVHQYGAMYESRFPRMYTCYVWPHLEKFLKMWESNATDSKGPANRERTESD